MISEGQVTTGFVLQEDQILRYENLLFTNLLFESKAFENVDVANAFRRALRYVVTFQIAYFERFCHNKQDIPLTLICEPKLVNLFVKKKTKQCRLLEFNLKIEYPFTEVIVF